LPIFLRDYPRSDRLPAGKTNSMGELGEFSAAGGHEIAVGDVGRLEAKVFEDSVGHAIDGEVGGDGAGVGAELGVKLVVGEEALELIGQIGAVPGAEG